MTDENSNPVHIKVSYDKRDESRRPISGGKRSIDDEVTVLLAKQEYGFPIYSRPVLGTQGELLYREVFARMPQNTNAPNGLVDKLRSIRGLRLISIETYIPLTKQEFS